MNDINNNIFPKVLIIGESLHDKTGSGITLSNFFKDWPKENIAVLSGKNIWLSDTRKCENLFFWKTKSFFNSNEYQDTIITISNLMEFQQSNHKNNESKSFMDFWKELVKKGVKLVLDIFGISPLYGQIIFTDSMDRWIKNFNPDVIYTFLNNYSQFQLVIDINKKYKFPIVVHPTDDHIITMPPKGFLFYFWQNTMNKKFKYLLNIASGRLSICDYMSKIYKNRYDLEFEPFLNPIDIDVWLPYSKKNWKYANEFNIVYIGRYGSDNALLLDRLSKIVDELNIEGYNVNFELRLSPLTKNYIIKKFNKYSHTFVKEYIPHDKIHMYLSQYDLLYLPLGFNKKTKKIYSVSMSTKISEYMISGTPVLVNAPIETAYYQYANNDKWGCVLSADKKDNIKKAILELIDNDALRKHLGTIAIQKAIERHDAKKVRNDFKIHFLKASKTNHL